MVDHPTTAVTPAGPLGAGEEDDERRPFEPWRPRVGDRVRVRLSYECREDWGNGVQEPHPSWSDGATGTIDDVGGAFTQDSAESHQRHPYFVRLDLVGPGGTVGLCFAAIELDPLPRPGARGDGEGFDAP